MTRGVLIVILWIGCGVLAGGFVNANLRARFKESDARNLRENAAFSLGIGMIGGPLSLTVSFFVTGFWMDGWSLTCEPYKEKQHDDN